ncbi:MAG: transposase [Betaproteobacteria bacterium]|nr:transposase [Betaproteobacteria bacterium]
MPNFRSVDRNLKFIAVDFDAQILPGTFQDAVSVLVDQELDLTPFIETYRNDDTGAPAYHPSILLKVILFGYSRGLISSRAIAAACRQHVQFIALSADSQPDFSTLAGFVSRHTEAIQSLFTQVLVICNREGLIGHEMFAIDGVKLPSNAAKSGQRSSGGLRTGSAEGRTVRGEDARGASEAGRCEDPTGAGTADA